MIYLDHHATTPMAPEVVEAMVAAASQLMGNPSSVHTPGRAARAAVDSARRQVAAMINCRERELVFTSGGTEADNLALRGAWRAQRSCGRNRIVTTAVEHSAVLSTVEQLEAEGAEVLRIGVDADGRLDRSAFSAAMGDDVGLVSVMLANNETGVIFPVAELVEEAQTAGAWFHCDAVQGAGRLPIDVQDLGVDLLSLSAHKIQGPKGVGALFVRRDLPMEAIQFGGKQERGLRGGTENTLGIVGFGVAATLAAERIATRPFELKALRDHFEASVLSRVDGCVVHGGEQPRLPSVTNIGFDGIEGEAALLVLDMAGICASSGSACASGSLQPSHVLLAMGFDPEEAHESLRFSLGAGVDYAQLDRVVEVLVEQVPKLRALNEMSF